MTSIIAALTFALLVIPLAAKAQPAARVYRIGMLETRSLALNAANVEAFRQGLRTLGYTEGQRPESRDRLPVVGWP
jgi:hypothetical protein